jgi:dTDP-4-amino-4,6-dideoxygalactose transaminase
MATRLIDEKIRIAEPYNDPEIERMVLSVLRSGRLVQGKLVKRFEEEMGRYLGSKHVVAVNSGTAALHAAISAIREKATRGMPEVITTTLSFSATANAILHAGCRPVFTDVDRETFNIDESLIEDKIGENTIAIEPVDVFGVTANLLAINSIAKSHSLTVIEDAAEAIGASHGGVKVGNVSDLTCFSTYATKNMHSGEGGFITTNDDAFELYMRTFRNQGQISKYRQTILGYNYRMQEISAAIALGQVQRLDEINARRREHAVRLLEGLSGTDCLCFQRVREPREHAWYMFAVTVDENRANISRDKLVAKLNGRGVEADVAWPTPIHLQPYYQSRYGFREGDFPNAEQICRTVLQLPIQPNLSTTHIDEVVATVRSLIK